MKLKPSCLKGMENMYGISQVDKFIDEKDSLSLEDSSGRVKIDAKSNINVDEFVTGIPVAFKGQLNNKQIFVVNDVLFYRVNDTISIIPADIEKIVYLIVRNNFFLFIITPKLIISKKIRF